MEAYWVRDPKSENKLRCLNVKFYVDVLLLFCTSFRIRVMQDLVEILNF